MSNKSRVQGILNLSGTDSNGNVYTMDVENFTIEEKIYEDYFPRPLLFPEHIYEIRGRLREKAAGHFFTVQTPAPILKTTRIAVEELSNETVEVARMASGAPERASWSLHGKHITFEWSDVRE